MTAEISAQSANISTAECWDYQIAVKVYATTTAETSETTKTKDWKDDSDSW